MDSIDITDATFSLNTPLNIGGGLTDSYDTFYIYAVMEIKTNELGHFTFFNKNNANNFLILSPMVRLLKLF